MTKGIKYIKGKDGYSIGMINHENKTVSPIHGYYHPNPSSKTLAQHAKRLGYKYTDPGLNKENTDRNTNLIRLTESDLHRIVKESVYRILKEHKWDADAWEMPADEYETNPFNGRTEGEFNFIDKTKRMNNRTNANVAQKIHPQTNSNYGSSKVLGHDYNTPEGRKELEKWTNLDKSVYKI